MERPMTGHILFVRFFAGYTPAFLYHRFVSLPDDKVASALEAMCNEWNQNSRNRKRLQKWRAEQLRAETRSRKESAKEVQRWDAGTLARPGINWQLPPPPRSTREILTDRPPPTLRTGPASFD